MNNRMWRCTGNNSHRLITADTEQAAAEKCMEVYGFHPESVTEIFRNPDE